MRHSPARSHPLDTASRSCCAASTPLSIAASLWAPALVKRRAAPGPLGRRAQRLWSESVAVTSPSPAPQAGSAAVLERFHPAVREWFERRFPEGPTEAQAGGWPAIVAGRHTLVCAPTGSGKTLAGFLAAIDALYREHEAGGEIQGVTKVVYLSPLKALAVD